MAELLFPPPVWPTLPVQGETAAFPVRRVFCVGRNYAAHAREMGAEPDREAPFYFTKSALAVARGGESLPYPPGTSNYHHEVELVVAIGAPAFRVAATDAMAAVFGYAVGFDMTRRDLQQAARVKQRPWDLGKDVEGSAVFGPITRAADFGIVADQRITLTVDGETRQSSRLSDMIWSVGDLIADLSTFYHLAPGDLILTGTPEGVGPVKPGQTLRGTIDGLASVTLTIGAPE